MRLRHKATGTLGSSSRFNIHALAEIIVTFQQGDMDSDFIRNYDAWIEAKQEWVDLSQAFKDRDVITDDYNTSFFEPKTEEDRTRGYTL